MDETIGLNTSDASPWRSRWPIVAIAAATLAAVLVWAVVASGDDGVPPAENADESVAGSGVADPLDDFTPADSEPDVGPDGPTDESGNPIADTAPDGLPPESTSPPSTVETTTPPTTTLPDAPVEPPSVPEAEDAVVELLDQAPEILNPVPEGTGVAFDASQVAADALLDELRATAVEFEALGWMQVGVPTVDGVTVLRAPTEESPIDAVIEVCVDSGNVRIVDENGVDVRSADTPARSLNIYTLRFVDGRWLAADQSFPDEPDC